MFVIKLVNCVKKTYIFYFFVKENRFGGDIQNISPI